MAFTHFFHGSIVGNSPDDLINELEDIIKEITMYKNDPNFTPNYGGYNVDFDAGTIDVDDITDVYDFKDWFYDKTHEGVN